MDDGHEYSEVYPTLAELLDLFVSTPQDLNDAGTRTRVHERNVRHLRRYARARCEHLEAVEGVCSTAPLCCGKPVRDALQARLAADDTYFDTLILSAIGEIGRLIATAAKLTTEVTRLDAELINMTGDLNDTNRQLFEARAQLAACESIVADARYRPADS
jgi:hypothetical protein